MSFSDREWWGLIHGMILGAFFLLAFSGGLAELWGVSRAAAQNVAGHVRRLQIGTAAMALAAWATVITGTWIVYPWYRDPSPDSPRSTLLANPDTASWHQFGMEWKEHIAWLSPMLATAVAAIVIVYGSELAKNRRLRWMVLALFVLAFAFAAVAGLLGALITKAAPVV
jgi:hypothetical protein